MSTKIDLKFRPTEKQEAELDQLLETQGKDAYFAKRTEMEAEWNTAIEARATEIAEKLVKERNSKDQKEIFARFQKQYPNLKVDMENIKAKAPAYVVEDFEKNKISLETLIMKSIGSQQAVAAISGKQTEQAAKEGDEPKVKSADEILDGDDAGDESEKSDGVDAPNLNNASGSTGKPGGSSAPDNGQIKNYTRDQGLSELY